uniref:Uncharacterized protein n=1 Tax=Anguilla anguilla TaxID=7936 RepID=A0A0E9T330_ANGAN
MICFPYRSLSDQGITTNRNLKCEMHVFLQVKGNVLYLIILYIKSW